MAFLQDADALHPGLRAILPRLAAWLRRPPAARRDDGPGPGGRARPADAVAASPGTDAATRLLLRDLGHR